MSIPYSLIAFTLVLIICSSCSKQNEIFEPQIEQQSISIGTPIDNTTGIHATVSSIHGMRYFNGVTIELWDTHKGHDTSEVYQDIYFTVLNDSTIKATKLIDNSPIYDLGTAKLISNPNTVIANSMYFDSYTPLNPGRGISFYYDTIAKKVIKCHHYIFNNSKGYAIGHTTTLEEL